MTTIELDGKQIEIIPCPICGGTDISFDSDADNDEGKLMAVLECYCGAYVEAESQFDCIKLWNEGKAD